MAEKEQTQAQKDEAARQMQEAIDKQAADKKKAEEASVKDAAEKFLREQEEKNKLKPLSTPIVQATSAAKACPGENTVTMVFPHQVMCWTDSKVKVIFPPGIQEVPVSLKDNWYLKACGVKMYDKKGGGE